MRGGLLSLFSADLESLAMLTAPIFRVSQSGEIFMSRAFAVIFESTSPNWLLRFTGPLDICDPRWLLVFLGEGERRLEPFSDFRGLLAQLLWATLLDPWIGGATNMLW